TLQIGVDGQDGAPVVTFGNGSMTDVVSFSLTNGSLVNVVLNADNKAAVQGNNMTYFSATTATADATSTMRFIVDSSAANGNRYIGAPIASLQDFNANLIAQVAKGGTGIALAVKGGSWLLVDTFDTPTGNVHRYNSSNVLQNSAATFDGAFLDGTGTATATGDKIILTSDANSAAVTNLTDVTALSIYSNLADTQRTITNTNVTEDSGFLMFDGENDVTLSLFDVKFTGGTGSKVPLSTSGGAIYRKGNMTLIGNAVFENNTARNGGAVGARISGEDSITLNGYFQFLNNEAVYGGGVSAPIFKTFGMNTFIGNSATYGGAVNAGTQGTFIGESTFIGNVASDSGGAIYNQGEIVFAGNGSKATFRENKVGSDTVGWTNNDIYAHNVTIRDGGTYLFGGGIEATKTLTIGAANQAGTPDVTFGSGSITNVPTLTLYDAHLTLDNAASFTVSTLTAAGSSLHVMGYDLRTTTEQTVMTNASGTIWDVTGLALSVTPGQIADNHYATIENVLGGIVIKSNSSGGAVYNETTKQAYATINTATTDLPSESLIVTADITETTTTPLTDGKTLAIRANQTAGHTITTASDGLFSVGSGSADTVNLTLANLNIVGKGITQNAGNTLNLTIEGNVKFTGVPNNSLHAIYADEGAKTILSGGGNIVLTDSCIATKHLEITGGTKLVLGDRSWLEISGTYSGTSSLLVTDRSTLEIGLDGLAFSYGDVTVSDYGSIVMNIGDTYPSSFQVTGNLSFEDTSTLKLNFDDNFTLTEDMEPILLFTADEIVSDLPDVEWTSSLSDLLVELFSEKFDIGSGVVQGLYARVTETGGNPVPEPTTWAMLLLGLAGLAIYARRKK
ncbi:MAG: PEP-CTERM sorting domain-containing protein, partial [Planctomycetia bacterium]|nr:PEP-CTERM sorting domain-containing protein [Planctomycetia bacterium]